MKPVYKSTKIVCEHCPECKERLMGNNSMIIPWKCKCGTWVANRYPFTGDYEIIKDHAKTI